MKPRTTELLVAGHRLMMAADISIGNNDHAERIFAVDAYRAAEDALVAAGRKRAKGVAAGRKRAKGAK
jgi:hypothetical protein